MKSKATIKIVLDTKAKEQKRKLLKIRVTHARQSRLYSIGDDTIRLTVTQFANSNLKDTKDAIAKANIALRYAEEVIQELSEEFTFDSFKIKYKSKLTGRSIQNSSITSLLSEYLREHTLEYKSRKSYETSVNWILRYKKNATISSVNSDFVVGLVKFMKTRHLQEKGKEMSENSIRIYLRQLRAIFNYAIEKDIVKDNPFSGIKLGSVKRQKAALTSEELKRIMSYTPQNKREEMGKDFFLLSLYCSGANLGDILMLKNSNIENDTVTFVRRKTKKTGIEVVFTLIEKAKSIFNRYGKISSKHPNAYILPYLEGANGDGNIDNRIKRVNRKVNEGLKMITDKLGLRHITTYTARHTYATVLMQQDMTAEQIQKFLGHSTSKTTQTYLGSLSTSILDANKNILENLGE